MSEHLYDEDYTGPRWRYALLLRPMHFTSMPAGWILKSHRRHIKYPHGTVAYPRQLTDDEVHRYDLELVEDTQLPDELPDFLKLKRDEGTKPAPPVDPFNIPNVVNHKPRPTDLRKGERLLLMPCTDMKRPGEGLMHAIDRYDGPYFRTLRTHMPQDADRQPVVLILSAKHKLITPYDRIPDYNSALSQVQALRWVEEGIDHLPMNRKGQVIGMSARVLFRNLGHDEERGYYPIPYRDVFILGPGHYGMVMKAWVWQAQQVGFVSPDAAIRTQTGGIGCHLKQLGEWLRRDNVAQKPRVRITAADITFRRSLRVE